MPYDPDQHHRRSIRLRGYDYATAGAYFVTVVVQGRACLLGEVAGGLMIESHVGWEVHRAWSDLSRRFSAIDLDALVVMPNHVHGIILLNDAAEAGARQAAPLPVLGTMPAGPPVGAPLAAPRPNLATVIRAFKSISAIAANRLLGREGERFWQRNYYEHVIRTDAALDRIREYIIRNPEHWAVDEENPDNPASRRIH